jgi:predicted tellurium resistance membrane protein TerC
MAAPDAQWAARMIDVDILSQGAIAAFLQVIAIDLVLAGDNAIDNVLAVAGAARDHLAALVFGLGLSIVMMGFAASLVARLLNRHRWIAYIGLAIILYVACDMIWRGILELRPHLL